MDYSKKLSLKGGRPDRHSATGRSRNEQPKKGGRGGKTVWGSYEDDIVDATRSQAATEH